MKRKIDRVAVLGAGVMGSQIAAHLANAGIETVLLDIVPRELSEEEAAQGLTLESPEVRNRIVRRGLEYARKVKPAAFFVPEAAELIRLGNFEDNMDWLQEVDWIIEAVVEDLTIKRALFRRVEQHRRPGTIVTSNTSGIPIARLGEGLSEEFRQHLLGTHFFNPPRYMRLLEVIPTSETLPDVVETIVDFCDRRLGKNIVYAKDTPNFIANRIGTLAALYTIKVMMEGDYTIEEVDAMTGPIIGHPKSATFRTLDLAGLDTAVRVAQNLYESVPDDDKRDLFVVPDFMQEMIRRGWIGEKAGQGFYKRVKTPEGREILALDYKTLEYRPRQKPKLPTLDMVRNIEDLGERLRRLVYSDDRVGRFLWKTMSETLVYAANRAPEIADDILQIDRAIRWGFNYELGPFETWDAIGVDRAVQRLKEEGRPIPQLVEKLLATGKTSFYETREGQRYYFDFNSGEHKPEPPRPGVIILSSLKQRQKVIKKNAGASLIDLGDGVACLEFHTKMNAIGEDIIQMMNYAVKEVEQNFEGLVIGNQGEHFSAGANLMLLLLAAQEGEWDEIDLMVRAFQKANLALRYSDKPVVVAPFGMTLAGGCEIMLRADRVRAAAESYIGLVEVGVGLIPAGGGTTEMLARALDRAPRDEDVDLLPYVREVFELIGMAKVSTSAAEARKLGYLRESDKITMNRDRLIEDAKQTVLAMVREGYQPPKPRKDIPVLGESALAALKLGVHLMYRAGQISEYDQHIGNKLAWILCGGDITSPTTMPEHYFLDLEREVFLHLCGEPKTQQRMQHMLKTGKPLRN
ncbi:MAG: 3-hydroxyacyl-CoA dehydrogenase/enoyl-CoA hydratase family protein [Acidobacteria bacterium]|nr:MAG: 3-hydroxyacyl-CoA dehydrogenase/enoyl-CoA hydratase family protein [Acidobacteriota bacterium]